MEEKEMVLYMNLALGLITVIVFVVLTTKTKMKEDIEFARKQQEKKIKRFYKYYNNVFTRKSFRSIVELYGSLSCYDENEAKVNSVTLFETSMMITLAFPTIAAIIMRDIGITILAALLGFVYYNNAVNKRMDKIYVNLMEETSLALGAMREAYVESNNIPMAVLHCDKSPYLEVPLKSIYHSLVDVNGAERLREFTNNYPVRILRTLANTCYIVNESGSVRTADGKDSFSEDLQTLRQECDSEVRRLIKQKIAFSSLSNLSLVGLGIVPLAEIYLLNMIPGTASLLKGMYGTILHIAVMVSTIFVYWYLAMIQRPSVVNSSDTNSSLLRLSNNKRWNSFAQNFHPKKIKTQDALNEKIKGALSSKDIQYIYTAKIVTFAGLVVISFFLLVSGTIAVRHNFYNNYNSLSFIPQNMTENQAQQVMRWDNDFMQISQEDYALLTDEDITSQAKGRISGLSDSQAADQCVRIRKKYEGYHNATFKWYYVLISYACGLVGWFSPEIMLGIRKSLVDYEATDDIMQLQTMMIVLSETKYNVFKAIGWLEKQSTVHKAALRQCHYAYSSNPYKALDELQDSTTSADFKRLIRKLKSASFDLSLHDAFSDMVVDKQNSLTIRELLRNEELESRKNSAKLYAIAPAAIALVGSFIGPVLILGVNEMMNTMSSLQGFA